MFIDVARAGNFAAVARTRNLDPSSVSRTIAALEAELGVRLFQRSTRQLTLNAAGEQLLERIVPALEELERACHDIAATASAPAGKLRLTSSTAFGQLRILPLLGQFQQRYPHVDLECVFTDETLDLIEHRIDLAIRHATLVVGDVVATRLTRTRCRVVAAPSYLKQAAPLHTPSDVSAHTCLLLPYPGFRYAWHFRGHDDIIHEYPVHGTLIMSSPLALRDAAIMGLGLALLADWLVEEHLQNGQLVDIFPTYDITPTSFEAGVWLIYPTRRLLPHKVRVLIDFLKEHFATEPPSVASNPL